MTCSASGDGWSCDRKVAGNGLCNSHYWQSRNKPELTEIKRRQKDQWVDGRRWCTSCETHQDPGNFSADRGRKDGLSSECKRCAKDRQLRINFRMTLEEYEEMLSQQGGSCAICKGSSGNKALAVDHDHACCPGKKTCGKCTRRLLCGDCNMAVGLFRDNPELLRKAADYLEETS